VSEKVKILTIRLNMTLVYLRLNTVSVSIWCICIDLGVAWCLTVNVIGTEVCGHVVFVHNSTKIPVNGKDVHTTHSKWHETLPEM